MNLGATVTSSGIHFSAWSGTASRMWVSLFEGDVESARPEMARGGDGVFEASVPGLAAGARYGFRADGDYDPARGKWFDPDKLLIDPYAIEIDRAFVYDARLAARRGEGGDTAPLMPKAVAVALPPRVDAAPPLFRPGGLIYEVSVRAFTKLHPDVPERQRGTVAALAHPAVIAHLTKLGVSAVELMPVTAWIDERHLPPLGLRNAWGYNPVSFMALDPRLAPGGIAELRDTLAALRAAGIGTILDLVFNHTGESDALGPTLSLRGLDNHAYYRHAPGDPGLLVNDTGCGNTVACDHPRVRELILASLRHFVLNAGVDGFRFDLAPILGRTGDGFDPQAETLRAIAADPVLADRVMIAEPWDIGPGGYQLGRFPKTFLEWNDAARDDFRRFWRGDPGTVGALATRLAGSSDIFGRDGSLRTRTINFIAAHDGMTLADITAYGHKHNHANGEHNRDGHDENLSWNNGVEGETDDEDIRNARRRDAMALLATLFASRGTILLAAGDEFGRSQKGNNNAYAQDNAIAWLDWAERDMELETYTAALSAVRLGFPALHATEFLVGAGEGDAARPTADWLSTDWTPLDEARWNDPRNRRLAMVIDGQNHARRIAVLVNGDRRAVAFHPRARPGHGWRVVSPARPGQELRGGEGALQVPGRSVVFLAEQPA
ncbi:MAG: glycogen debranching protein GlgX [Mesorhizobium sp.]|nr:glycogen debranching protein GlgX [Mesorhizobium sp.]